MDSAIGIVVGIILIIGVLWNIINAIAFPDGGQVYIEVPDKALEFVERIPNDVEFIFVSQETLNMLKSSRWYSSIDNVAFHEYSEMHPGVIGRCYGYSIILDEELAGTYL